ncbi:hypothetical protein BDV98DRAFT_58780 [Pterulicium gracile]|uniref:Uncharacterized protein n=1 Tax=Pterulicium gracile TaxID=1884261 RepID=A0A5C3PZ89_9AGAR|nr:hypothetical protein BDV98DRAFT_58780 [Pterula gracilis]
MLLHLSLFLFFTGLAVFLYTLDRSIATVITTITAVVYVAYVVSKLLPLWHANCPYKTPLSTYTFPVLRVFKPHWSTFWKHTPLKFDQIWQMVVVCLCFSFLLLPPCHCSPVDEALE